MSVVVRMYIDFVIILLIPIYSTCIRSFFAAAASLLLCSFFKRFFVSLMNCVMPHYI